MKRRRPAFSSSCRRICFTAASLRGKLGVSTLTADSGPVGRVCAASGTYHVTRTPEDNVDMISGWKGMSVTLHRRTASCLHHRQWAEKKKERDAVPDHVAWSPYAATPFGRFAPRIPLSRALYTTEALCEEGKRNTDKRGVRYSAFLPAKPLPPRRAERVEPLSRHGQTVVSPTHSQGGSWLCSVRSGRQGY